MVPKGEQTLLCRAGAVWIGQHKGSSLAISWFNGVERDKYRCYVSMGPQLLDMQPLTMKKPCIQASPALRGPGTSAGGQKGRLAVPQKKVRRGA